jgi:hypothetical protein
MLTNTLTSQASSFVRPTGTNLKDLAALKGRLLDQVVRLVSAGDEPSGEAVQPILMRVKQGGEPLASVIRRRIADRESEHRLSAHTWIDVSRPDYFECRRNALH